MVRKDKIVLGIIGYNEGNGHPYSFSAIINGYVQKYMDNSPYPVIANYLKKRSTFEFGINNFKVVYVWTPFDDISADISRCCYIPNIVDNYNSLIDCVDAVIIARDDAESHRKIAEPFLKNGKYVFIDKPLCNNYEDLEFFIPYLKNGQLMSCSGFRYHPLYLNKEFINLNSRRIVAATAVTTIDWYKYGIHILEGIQPAMKESIEWVQNIGENEKDIVRIQYKSGKYAIIIKDNNLRGFCANFYTNDGKNINIDFNDNFTYFRNMLLAFHDFVTLKKSTYSYNDTINLIMALIASAESKIIKQPVYIKENV